MPDLTVDPQPDTLTSSDSVSITPSSHNFSKSILIGILMFVLLSLTSYGAYWYGQSVMTEKVSAPTPEVNPDKPQKTLTPAATDEMANWKTYTDTKYRFSFKYPKVWEFKPCLDVLCGTFTDGKNEIAKLEGFSEDCEVTSEPSFPNAEKATGCGCLADGPGIHMRCTSPTEEKTFASANGVRGFSFFLDELKNDSFEKKRGPYSVIFFSKPILSGGLLYEKGLYFELLDNTRVTELNQILSTFKFL